MQIKHFNLLKIGFAFPLLALKIAFFKEPVTKNGKITPTIRAENSLENNRDLNKKTWELVAGTPVGLLWKKISIGFGVNSLDQILSEVLSFSHYQSRYGSDLLGSSGSQMRQWREKPKEMFIFALKSLPICVHSVKVNVIEQY